MEAEKRVERPVPVMSPIELVLGYLWRGPATVEEIRGAYMKLPSRGVTVPVAWPEVEAVIRGLRAQGLLREAGGRLILARERLHPMARRAAELAARDLELAGVVGG